MKLPSSLHHFGFIFLLAALLVSVSSCSSEQPDDDLTLAVLSTADLHGHVFPWDYYADAPDEAHSLLKALTLADSLSQHYEHTLRLDTGDWLQGNPFAEFYARVDTSGRYPLLQALEWAGFDAIVVGNHEFNFGIPHLRYRIEQTDVDFLAANVVSEETGEPAFKPYIIREYDEFKIGVLGLTTPGSAIWDRPRVEGRLRFEDGLATAETYVAELQAQDVDVIILALHTGFEGSSSYTSDAVGPENFGKMIADTVPGIHAMILSHTHRVIEDLTYTSAANPQGVAVIQPGRWASHLGYTELGFRRTENGTEVRIGTNRALPVEHASPHREYTERLQDEHERVRTHFTESIATTDSVWESSDARYRDRAITDLIQYVQMQATGADLSSSAIFNTDARFEDGVITRGSLARLYPYENTLYHIRISGRQLKDYLEFSARYYEESTGTDLDHPVPSGVTPGYNFDVVYGAEYTIDLTRPVGERIQGLTFEGQPVQDDDSFTLALNSYRAVGGGDYDMIADAEVIEVIDISVRLLIEDFISQKGHINPEDVARTYWQINW